MFLGVLSVHNTHVCVHRDQKGIRSLGTGAVADSCDLSLEIEPRSSARTASAFKH